MSFNVGGLFKSLINPMNLMQLAMGPAGWASLAMKTIGTAIAQQVIQQLGQKLGLPQGIINLAQQAFSAATGNPGGGVQSIADAVSSFAQQAGLSPQSEGQLMRESQEAALRLQTAIQKSNVGAGDEAEEGGSKSFLVAIAKALGKVMDQKALQMKGLADDIAAMTSDTRAGYINGVNGNAKDSAGAVSAETTKISSKSTLLQAYSQELSMISNAASNVIKTIGEANVTTARKG
jgi:uncharacterized protein YjbJ (UPF0337 family)